LLLPAFEVGMVEPLRQNGNDDEDQNDHDETSDNRRIGVVLMPSQYVEVGGEVGEEDERDILAPRCYRGLNDKSVA
jgi:hypothetical protein